MEALSSGIVAAIAAATIAVGCGTRPQAAVAAQGKSCSDTVLCSGTDVCVNDLCVPYAVCPPQIEPTYDSIFANVFSQSCGGDGTDCHSSVGSVDSGGLDLSLADAGDPYVSLLGKDGTGAFAENISGSVRGELRRVAPGDPDNSFLVIKLMTKKSNDPMWGHGMPYPYPASVCPPTLSAIRTWIQNGAEH